MGINSVAENGGIVSQANVVPLIDILLVLLVIFMAIRPAADFGLPVELPEQVATPAPTPVDVIVVQVLGDGTLRINQDPVQWPELPTRLAEIFKMRASRVAFVRGDRALEFGMVARAIDAMRGSGITTVGLITPELANAR